MVRSRPAAITGYHPDGVGTAVALVNAVTTSEGDASDEGISAVLARFGFLVEQMRPDDPEALRSWGRALRPVFTIEDLGAATEHLNGLMAQVPMHPHIADHGKGPHLHYAESGARLIDRVRANTTVGLAMVLCEHGTERFGVCAWTTCEDVYADLARGPRKRYCSKACLNRATVAAYRARRSQ